MAADLTGQRFGRLVVVGPDPGRSPEGKTPPLWACRCDCGETTMVGIGCLRSGHTRSCGCLRLANLIPPGSNRIDLPVDEIRALREAGWTHDRIAQRYGVSPQTIRNRLKA